MKTIIIMRCAPDLEHEFSGVTSDDICFLPSFYGDAAPQKTPDSLYFHYFKGGKWSGIYDLFQTYPDLIDSFDYFWFVDDDIRASCQTAADFIKIVKENSFQLAQPALTADSYWAHRITLENRGLLYRHTNLVELMMPIMHRDVVRRALPLFKGRDAAMGIDFMWHQLTNDPARDVAIIDATPMQHSRPRQKLLNNAMKKCNKDIFKERDDTIRQFSIKRQMPVVLGAKTRKNQEIKRNAMLLLRLALELGRLRTDMRMQKLRMRDFRNLIIHQLFGKTDSETFDQQSLSAILDLPAAKKKPEQ